MHKEVLIGCVGTFLEIGSNKIILYILVSIIYLGFVKSNNMVNLLELLVLKPKYLQPYQIKQENKSYFYC